MTRNSSSDLLPPDLLAVDCQFNSNEHLHYYDQDNDVYTCPFNFPPVVLESDWMAIRLFQLKKIASKVLSAIAFKVLSALDEGNLAISVTVLVVLAMLPWLVGYLELLWQN